MTYDASQEVDLDVVDLDGGILIKTLYLSIDPYMRVRMRDPEIKSYLPAFEVGEWSVTDVYMSIRTHKRSQLDWSRDWEGHSY